MNRRIFLASCSCLAGTFWSRVAWAQSLPSVAETINLLSSRGGASLLLTRYALAYDLATLAFLELEGIGSENPELLETLPLFPQISEGSAAVFTMLSTMASGEGAPLRDQVIQALRDGPDPIVEVGDQQETLVSAFVQNLEAVGVNPEADVVRQAVDSLTHVNRAAQIVISLGLCDVFPFSTRPFCNRDN